MNKLNSKLQPKIKENKCGEKRRKMAKKYSQKMRKTPTHTRERTQEAKNVAKNKKNKCLRKKKEEKPGKNIVKK